MASGWQRRHVHQSGSRNRRKHRWWSRSCTRCRQFWLPQRRERYDIADAEVAVLANTDLWLANNVTIDAMGGDTFDGTVETQRIVSFDQGQFSFYTDFLRAA